MSLSIVSEYDGMTCKVNTIEIQRNTIDTVVAGFLESPRASRFTTGNAFLLVPTMSSNREGIRAVHKSNARFFIFPELFHGQGMKVYIRMYDGGHAVP